MSDQHILPQRSSGGGAAAASGVRTAATFRHQPPLSSVLSHCNIQHTASLSADIGALFESEEFSDQLLMVEGTRFPVHRVVLAARSEYFRALFYGGMRESSACEITLEGINAVAFRYILMYVYTGQVSLVDLKEDTILDILGLAHQYNFCELEGAVSHHLHDILSMDNVCQIYNMALVYCLESLIDTCLQFMDINAQAILGRDSFYALSSSAIERLISRDSFCAPEPEIFEAVVEWFSRNSEETSSTSPSDIIGSVVRHIRLHLMDMKYLVSTVRASDLLSSDSILDAIASKTRLKDSELKHRGRLLPEENLATPRRGAVVIHGEHSQELLNGDNRNYDGDHGFTRHSIDTVGTGNGLAVGSGGVSSTSVTAGYPSSDDVLMNYSAALTSRHHHHHFSGGLATSSSPSSSATASHMAPTMVDMGEGGSSGAMHDQIVINLSIPSIINTMRLLLWDKDARSYSYLIEVSMDQQDWVRVIDHRAYLCRSWQKLHFPERVVRFIRIVGTHNTVNRVFHAVSFECYYTRTRFRLYKALQVPLSNVATIGESACVVEGVSRTRNALINGDTTNYDWDSGYTCHQLGSGSIIIQLAQPYYIGSMRFLLWDLDDRKYGYTVEVSTDQANWQTVCDRSGHECQSWQVVSFRPRPVTFIRIVGTHNTVNEVFHVVHFECPYETEKLYDECLALEASDMVTSATATTSGDSLGLDQLSISATATEAGDCNSDDSPPSELPPSVSSNSNLTGSPSQLRSSGGIITTSSPATGTSSAVRHQSNGGDSFNSSV